MAQSVSGVIETRQISELVELAKLNGSEHLLIDNNSEDTLKVTVDTLLGYIREQINAGTGPIGKGDTTINVLQPTDDDIPAESRPTDNFYLKIDKIYTV